MKSKPQSAALPYIAVGGGTEVLLITSRDTGRWVLPKGWLKSGLLPHMVAEHEAFEEAGIRGVLTDEPIGHYHYVKQMGDRDDIACVVAVYPLRVNFQYLDWPEREQRRLAWFTAEEAAEHVDEDGLAALLRGFRPGGE